MKTINFKLGKTTSDSPIYDAIDMWIEGSSHSRRVLETATQATAKIAEFARNNEIKKYKILDLTF